MMTVGLIVMFVIGFCAGSSFALFCISLCKASKESDIYMQGYKAGCKGGEKSESTGDV